MQVSRLKVSNFRGVKAAELDFDGHTLLVGGNNIGKSTICEALELALGPDRQSRFPVVEEFDFYNAPDGTSDISRLPLSFNRKTQSASEWQNSTYPTSILNRQKKAS